MKVFTRFLTSSAGLGTIVRREVCYTFRTWIKNQITNHHFLCLYSHHHISLFIWLWCFPVFWLAIQKDFKILKIGGHILINQVGPYPNSFSNPYQTYFFHELRETVYFLDFITEFWQFKEDLSTFRIKLPIYVNMMFPNNR